jgi:hypothetical protein
MTVEERDEVRRFRQAIREIQAEWQLGLDRISLEYSRRFDAIETAQAETIVRLGKLEERVLAVEMRIPRQPPRHWIEPGHPTRNG